MDGLFEFLEYITADINKLKSNDYEDNREEILSELNRSIGTARNFLMLAKQDQRRFKYEREDYLEAFGDNGAEGALLTDYSINKYLSEIERASNLFSEIKARYLNYDRGALSDSKETPDIFENQFYKKDNFWIVRYQGGKEHHLDDILGFSYIHMLIQKAGKIADVMEMHAVANDEPTPDERENQGLKKDDKIIKEELRDIIYKRDELKKDLKNAKNNHNEVEEDSLHKKIAEINEYIQKTGNEIKKEQMGKRKTIGSSIRTRIVNALKEVRKRIPELADHLDKHIDTGYKCIYNPPTEEIWRL